ncbi:TetR family transcriptional regulator [Pseudomonas shirazensis]|uniref:TetR family transcriptional regulator n=1 Tax=Pseudomonas shirazensis TaxID=2745494 RepID=UPI003D2CC080
MARKTAHETALTRQKLLLAGLDVFSEKGYSSATLEMVGVAAGCSRGAVYWHFGSKEKLLQVLLDEHRLPIEEIASEAGDWNDKVARIRDAFEQMVKEPHARQLCDILLHKSERCDESHAISMRLDRLRNQMYASYSSALQSCASQGRFNGSVNVPRLASFLAVCSIGLIFESVRQPIERANDYLASSFDLLIASLPIQ